ADPVRPRAVPAVRRVRGGPGGAAGQPGGHLHGAGPAGRIGGRPGRRRGDQEVHGGGGMNASWVAARAGVRRGWIELRHSFTTPNDLVTLVVWTAILFTAMLWVRGTTVPGTHFSLGTATLASMLGMNIGFNGMATLGGILTVEREDGTLLRAKATPNGMTGYLLGKVVTVSGTILISRVARRESGSSVAARREKA